MEFFRTYKTISDETTEGLRDLHINEDDEYDFMDESDDGEAAQRTGRGRRNPKTKLKYMQMLQDVAERKGSNILIELDDLDSVRVLASPC